MAETETDGARGATGEVATAPEGLVLGLDASTTAVKALVFDARGETVAEGRARLELLPAGPGGYEQIEKEILQMTQEPAPSSVLTTAGMLLS